MNKPEDVAKPRPLRIRKFKTPDGTITVQSFSKDPEEQAQGEALALFLFSEEDEDIECVEVN